MPAEDRRLTLLLGAFGDPGHAFPIIALGTELAARGHRVVVDTWKRWQPEIEAGGMEFVPAPEYQVFPTRERPLKPYEAAVRAARETLPRVVALGADAVVADILTPAPSLAGEMAGLPVATLIPHIDPRFADDWPPFSFGARLPRTAAGRALWRRVGRMTQQGLETGRQELNETRRRLDLPPRSYVHNGISRDLAIVATFPQLEYPRPADASTHAVGPLLWEPPFGEVELPEGDAPLVLVAPSTSQDPEQTLLRAAMAGLADMPVRVLGTWNRREPPEPIPVPANARMVEWVSYARTMPRCEVVVCHAGHGTLARALASGCTVVAVPAAGDMNENAARIDWAGVGVRVPRRFTTPRSIGLAVERALAEDGMRARAGELAAWHAANDPAARAADLVEEFARRSVRDTN